MRCCIRYPSPRVSYYFPSARQVPPIPIRASATIPLPRIRYPPSPSARQLLSPFRASATPHPHPRVSYYPPFCALGMRHALPTPGPRVSLFRSCYSPCRASGTSPLARVSSTPTPIRSSATIFLPRVPRIILIRASATIFLPHVRYPPPSGTPHPHLRVSYYPLFRASGMRQALPTPSPRVSLFRSCYSPCRALGTSPLPRVSSAPTPIRSSATMFLPRIPRIR